MKRWILGGAPLVLLAIVAVVATMVATGLRLPRPVGFQVPLVIDHLLQKWPGRTRIDPDRIGIFGVSAGGFTALTTIGGVPDNALREHCARAPESACRLWTPPQEQAALAFTQDPRVQAAVIAAPGYAFAFTRSGHANIAVPIRLWSGGSDETVPTATNVQVQASRLPRPAELHVAPGARRYSFLVPCGLLGPPLLCREPADFDRKAFHQSFDREIVRFFQAKLGPAPAS